MMNVTGTIAGAWDWQDTFRTVIIAVISIIVAAIIIYYWNQFRDKRKIIIKTWRSTERRGERIYPVINIDINNQRRRPFNIKEIGFIGDDKERISIPLHLFREDNFTIGAEDNSTFHFDVMRQHNLPSEGQLTEQVEKSSNAKDYQHNREMFEFRRKFNKQKQPNLFQVEKMYVKDTADKPYYSEMVKNVTQAFDI